MDRTYTRELPYWICPAVSDFS
ncbi:UNVERIFIED_CONTAM: hypothetical protein GTU68_039113 [Idotea baltica]|nr:hypothetical protein [Idotea baltica]